MEVWLWIWKSACTIHVRNCAASRKESSAELGGEEQAQLERSHAVLELLKMCFGGSACGRGDGGGRGRGKEGCKRKRRRQSERISRRGLLSVGTCKKKLSGCCSIVILLCKDTSKIICIHTYVEHVHTDTYHMISYKS